jgi:toluene monooxygenase electron transfer component
VGTATLFDAVPAGAGITLDGPYGLAYLRPDSPRDLMCIAGGSGLAPILSVVRGAVAEPRLAGRRIHVFYGARTQRDLAGRAQLEALPGFGARISFEAVLSEPSADPAALWSGPTGFVHERAREFIGERWADFEYYFAGPPPMAEAVQRMLIDRRVPFPQVHFDRFY